MSPPSPYDGMGQPNACPCCESALLSTAMPASLRDLFVLQPARCRACEAAGVMRWHLSTTPLTPADDQPTGDDLALNFTWDGWHDVRRPGGAPA